MKLVDEKKALTQVTLLKGQRKQFSQFDSQHAIINSDREKLNALRKTHLEDPKSKSLSDEFTQLQAEITKIKGENDKAFQSRNTLRDERTALQELREIAWQKKRQLQDEYRAGVKAFRDWEFDTKRAQYEERQRERDEQDKARRDAFAKKRLEEASDPAFGGEIVVCENLIAYFKSLTGEEKVEKQAVKINPQARSVEGNVPEGMVLKPKAERVEEFYTATAQKKKNRNDRGKAATPEQGKLQLNMGTIEELTRVNVSPPMSSAEFDRVIEDLKKQIEYYKSNQEKATQEVCLYIYNI